jgi:hypothetical protein
MIENGGLPWENTNFTSIDIFPLKQQEPEISRK